MKIVEKGMPTTFPISYVIVRSWEIPPLYRGNLVSVPYRGKGELKMGPYLKRSGLLFGYFTVKYGNRGLYII